MQKKKLPLLEKKNQQNQFLLLSPIQKKYNTLPKNKKPENSLLLMVKHGIYLPCMEEVPLGRKFLAVEQR
jgi:hypothetical protein